MSETEGSVRITVRMTAEQAEAMQRAFEEGKLDALGVSALTQAAVKPAVPYLLRLSYRRILAVASIACSISGVLPLRAPFAYAFGLMMAVGSSVLAYRTRDAALSAARYYLPAAGLLLNLVALICWPTTIGFFKTEGQHRFGIGDREADLNERRMNSFWSVDEPSFQHGDKILISFSENGPARYFVAGESFNFPYSLHGQHFVKLVYSKVDKSIVNKVGYSDYIVFPSEPHNVIIKKMPDDTMIISIVSRN